MIYHGIILNWASAAIYNEYTENLYRKLGLEWKLNAVQWNAYWSKTLEPNQDQPGIFNENMIIGLKPHIIWAKKYGLNPFIGIQNSYQQTGEVGWADYLGGDYINLDSNGRERYIAMLKWVAQNLPDVGISVLNFPYHGENHSFRLDDLRSIELHQVTLPLLYNEVRSVTNAPIIINPMKQGGFSPEWGSPEASATGYYKIVESFGWPFSLDNKLYYGYSNHSTKYNMDVQLYCNSWDGDGAKLRQHYQPLLEFKSKFPNLNFHCVESLHLRIHNSYPCNQRPIDPTRIAWAATHMNIMKQNNLGWMYHAWNGPSSPVEEDGSDTVLSELIKKYASISKIPLNILVQILGSGVGLYLINKIKKK